MIRKMGKNVITFLLAIIVAASAFTSAGVMSSYAKGTDDGTLTKEERFELAEELGVSEYMTDEGYLSEDYYVNSKSFKEMYESGVTPLLKSMTEEEITAWESGISLLTVDSSNLVSYDPPADEYQENDPTTVGLFTVNGHTAFCAQHHIATPKKGSPTSTPKLVTNNNIRKVMYYGYNGIEPYSGVKYTKNQFIVITSMALSYYYSGESSLGFRIDGTYVKALEMDHFMDFIKKKSAPPDSFKVYVVETNGGKTQDLMYYEYNPDGYIKVQKSSSDTGITSGNSNYSLNGAKYTIYKDSACKNSTGKTLTTGNNGASSALKIATGTYYLKETTAPKGYVLDSTVYTAKVTSSHSSSKPLTVNVKDKPITAKINLQKTSSMPECTDGSELYSLAGAEYSIYKDASCTQYVGKMTTDKDGKASLGNLPLNKYWVKETKAPDGYTIDSQVYALDLSTGKDSVVTGTVNSKDAPILDPAAIILRKVDKETGGDAQNNGTLDGAQFEVKFYDVISDTDPALNGEEPLRTWIFETNENGFLRYNNAFLVSGDELYTDPTGAANLPYGTMTFKEIKAPEGYLIDDTVIVQRTDGFGTGSIVYQTPTQEEDDLEMRVTKIDATTGKPVEGVTFVHTMPDGTTAEYTTDENGFIDISCLEYGTHKLKEKSAPDGFAVNTAEVEFKVAEDNTITIVKGDAAETDTNGKVSVKVADDGCVEVRMENKAAPYKVLVHKVNENETLLAGAEFTLYSDSDCKQEIAKGTTNDKGELYFNDLIVGKTYFLKETMAPDGYRVPVNEDGSDIIYKLQADSKITDNEFTFIVNDTSYTSDEGTYCVTGTKADRVCEMTVLNYTTQQLPETGSHNTLILIGAGIALVTVAGVIALKRKKN